MAIAFVNEAHGGGTNSFTTTAIDTTLSGTNLIIIGMHNQNSATPVPTDSVTSPSTNTWSPLTSVTRGGGANLTVQLFYCANPNTSSTHTFSTSSSGNNPYITVLTFSGGHASPFDTELAASIDQFNSASWATTSITPGISDALVVVAGTSLVAMSSINLSFNGIFGVGGGTNCFGSIAYLIEVGAPAAKAPTWTPSGFSQGASRAATFKPAAAAAATLAGATVMNIGSGVQIIGGRGF